MPRQKISRKEYELRRSQHKNIILTVLLICSIICLGLSNLYWNYMFDASIKEGAKNTVTAIEMTVACMSAGNVTQKQITDEYYEMFIKPKIEGGTNG